MSFLPIISTKKLVIILYYEIICLELLSTSSLHFQGRDFKIKKYVFIAIYSVILFLRNVVMSDENVWCLKRSHCTPMKKSEKLEIKSSGTLP